MKNFDEFKKAVEEDFVSYMGKDYVDYHVVIDEVRKVNETYCGLGVIPNKCDRCVSPKFRTEYMYTTYCIGHMKGMTEQEAFDTTLRHFANEMVRELEKLKLTDDMTLKAEKYLEDEKSFRDNLILQVIGVEKNAELLNRVPHRIVYGDLAVVYRLNIEDTATFLITHIAMKYCGINIDENEMYNIAYENTKKCCEVSIMSMSEVFREEGLSEEQIKEIVGDKETVYMVKTVPNYYSATLILDSSNFESVAEKLGGDLFISPSSNMEYLCELYDEEKVEMAMNRVYRINQGLHPEELLSYGVYHYDKDKKTIKNVTD